MRYFERVNGWSNFLYIVSGLSFILFLALMFLSAFSENFQAYAGIDHYKMICILVTMFSLLSAIGLGKVVTDANEELNSLEDKVKKIQKAIESQQNA